MLLDIVIAGLLVVTSGYCWRLNRRMSAFRNAKQELEQMIRSFDSAIRQAYESIAILKENSSDKNIQLIRDMEKVRFLANDLAYLVEKGEKLADTLESQVRVPQAASGGLSARSQPKPPSLPPRATARPVAAARPQPKMPDSSLPQMDEVRLMIDSLARSYVTEPAVQPGANRPVHQPLGYGAQPAPRNQQQRTQNIEKMLNQLHRPQAPAQTPAMAKPAAPVRQPAPAVAKPEAAPVKASATAGGGRNNRFFESLRVITPNE